MIKYQSTKWMEFGSRPTLLLQRQLRNNWYLYVDRISDLTTSKMIVVGRKGVASMFMLKTEDKANNKIILKDYLTKKVEKNLRRHKKLIKTAKFIGNPIALAIQYHQNIGPILLYSHYLERILTSKVNNLNRLKLVEKSRVKRLSEQNSHLRDSLVKIQDSYAIKARKYIKDRYHLKDFDYYLLTEIISKKKVTGVGIKKRKEFYAIKATKNSLELFTGSRAKKFLTKEKFRRLKIKEQSRIKGITASPGKVKGRVKVVNNLKDFKDYQSKVIVSYMTIPQYSIYLKKVKALVTDEGGINCHAAVISREFKIPCVVGTKIATQVFKDGDLVEVDAGKGIVKKKNNR